MYRKFHPPRATEGYLVFKKKKKRKKERKRKKKENEISELCKIGAQW